MNATWNADPIGWADALVVSSSGGIDSQASLVFAARLAREVGKPLHVVHADMGPMEHTSAAACSREVPEGHDGRGAGELVAAQADLAGATLHVVRRGRGTLIDQVSEKGRWPRVGMGPCQGTSDHKRGPIWTVYTALAKAWRDAGNARPFHLLEVRGEARHEGGKNGKRDKRLRVLDTTPIGGRIERHSRCTNGRRSVVTWFPLADMEKAEIWSLVRDAAAAGETTLPAWTYGAGMPRFSCAFCVFAQRPALMLAGELRPALLDELVQIEADIGQPFRREFSLAGIRDDLKAGARVDAADLTNAWDDQA